MVEIAPQDPGVAALDGLHLYHAGRSACAARVRLALEEKGLAWISHYVDIYKRENVSAAYFAINPKGLVPALVHDGRVIVESNDIMLYLEEKFPEPSFAPAAEPDRQEMARWMARCGDLHLPGVKTFAYAKVHAANVVKSDDEVALYRSLQTDPELLAFHAKHDGSGDGFTDEDVEDATALLDAALSEADDAIGEHGWLAGRDYSLADMSWSTAIVTLQGVGFPLDGYAHLADWFERISERPAFQVAVAAWRDPELKAPPPGSSGRDLHA